MEREFGMMKLLNILETSESLGKNWHLKEKEKAESCMERMAVVASRHLHLAVW